MEEACHIWPERNIGCIVSIGTGVPDFKDVGRKILPLFETLKAISVDTEKVAREVGEELRFRYGKSNIYFRFNVQRGLEKVGLEEWNKFGETKIATEAYLKNHWHDVDLCASQVYKPNGTLKRIQLIAEPFPSKHNLVAAVS